MLYCEVTSSENLVRPRKWLKRMHCDACRCGTAQNGAQLLMHANFRHLAGGGPRESWQWNESAAGTVNAPYHSFHSSSVTLLWRLPAAFLILKFSNVFFSALTRKRLNGQEGGREDLVTRSHTRSHCPPTYFRFSQNATGAKPRLVSVFTELFEVVLHISYHPRLAAGDAPESGHHAAHPRNEGASRDARGRDHGLAPAASVSPAHYLCSANADPIRHALSLTA